jgi:monofunctional biosynthetic peptidoglycan transglycosylase
MDINFETSSKPDWRAVNDGVMGGLSSGGPKFENDHMVFSGTINTNGGGFSSVRAPMQLGELKDADSLRLNVKSDGRAYRVTFRTDARYGWRQISFQAPIPATPKGEWAEVTVPLDNLRASVFGRPIRGAEFNKNKVEEIGIILADGRDGPFSLTVDWIKGCAS